MDIAALSIMLSQSSVQQQAGISVMKLAMELLIQPYLGSNVDVQV